jgi:hypothetical protein
LGMSSVTPFPPASRASKLNPELHKIYMFFILLWGQGSKSRYSDYATGWTVRGSNPRRGKRLSLLQNIQPSYGAHPASYSVSTGG